MSEEKHGPRKVGDILSRVFAKYGYGRLASQTELERCWIEVAGTRVAARTRVGSLRRGVLEILVDNSILLQELEGFQKQTLLSNLQTKVRQNKIESLRFRRA